MMGFDALVVNIGRIGDKNIIPQCHTNTYQASWICSALTTGITRSDMSITGAGEKRARKSENGSIDVEA